MDDSMIGRWLSDLPMNDPTRKRTSKPQLRRFIHHDKPVHYRKCLGEGTEGVVYRVRIEGSIYALKIFKDWEYCGPPELKERQQPYTFPFSHECRAFARLDSVNENGTWAVRCHGWMRLSDNQFKPFRLKDSGYSRWAIVKDYLPNPIDIDDVPDIRRKMSIARGALLHPGDMQPRNYRGSFLVDLGRVKTYPYPRRLWSTSRKREYYAYFDEYASNWQVSVRDGTVVERSVNEVLKRIEAERVAQEKQERSENNCIEEVSDTETIVPSKVYGEVVDH